MTSRQQLGDSAPVPSGVPGQPAADRVLDALPEAVVAVDLDGQVQSWNSAAEQLFGWTRDEATGRTVYELVLPEGQVEPARSWVREVVTAGSAHRQWTVVDRSGSRSSVTVAGSPLTGPDGDVVGMVGVARLDDADRPAGGQVPLGRQQDLGSCPTRIEALEQARQELQQREALFRALVQRASDVAVVNAADGSVLYCSPACEQIFGFPPADVLGGNGYDYVHPEDEPEVRASLERIAAEHGAAATITYRHRHADGGWRWVEATMSNRLGDPDISGIVLNLRDVTAKVDAERALRDSEERYRAIVETAQEGIWVADATGRTIYMNAKMAELLGRPVEQTCGRPALELFESGPAALVALRLRDRAGRGPEQYDLDYEHPQRGQRAFRVGSSALHDGAGAYVGSLAMVSDVTEVRRGEAALRRMALHDSVTDLPNRTLLADRLAQASERCLRTHTPLSVLFVDVDQFKVVNDALGHAGGDELLRAVAGRLSAAARPGDTVARFGGDEFVVVAEGAGADDAEQIAAVLQASLQEPFEVADRSIVVSASIGVASSPASPPDELLQHADAAMYAAKSRGRRRIERFDAATAETLRDRLGLSADLRVALDSDGLELHYQPVVDVTDGRLLGVEALARWTHPDRGPVPAPLLVAVAQETGLATEFDRWVVERACSDLARLRRAGVLPGDAYVAVNVSAGHVSRCGLVDLVLTAARVAGLPTSNLMVELTESDAVDDLDTARATLQRLRDAGVLVAVDDFGTGYSSLAYLKRLPVDRIKIDRLFVDSITSSADDLAIVASIIELSRAIGASVIAEGVETRQQLGLLKRLGCQAGQGWLWSRAVPPDELPRLMAARRGRGFDVEHQSARPPRRSAEGEAVGAEHGLHRLLQLQAASASLPTIAAALNSEGYRTPRGTRWHPRSVASVVAGRAYPSLWRSGTAGEAAQGSEPQVLTD